MQAGKSGSVLSALSHRFKQIPLSRICTQGLPRVVANRLKETTDERGLALQNLEITRRKLAELRKTTDLKALSNALEVVIEQLRYTKESLFLVGATGQGIAGDLTARSLAGERYHARSILFLFIVGHPAVAAARIRCQAGSRRIYRAAANHAHVRSR